MLSSEQNQQMQVKLDILNKATHKIPLRQNPQANRQRELLFRTFDLDKKGYLSYIDIQQGIRDVIQNNALYAAKQASLKAFQNARTLQNQVENNKNTAKNKPNQKPQKIGRNKDQSNQDCLGKQGFLFFLLFLARYFEIYLMYQLIDSDESDGILINEFIYAKEFFTAWGLPLENPEKEFRKYNQNMSGAIFFNEFLEWAEKKNLRMNPDMYVVDSIQHLQERFHYQKTYNRMQSSAQHLDLEKEQENENEFFKVKWLNKDSNKTLQLKKKKKKGQSIHASLNNTHDTIKDDPESQQLFDANLENQIQEQFEQLSSQQQLMIQENFFLKQVTKSLEKAQSMLDSPDCTPPQQSIYREKIKHLKKQEQTIKTKIVFDLAEKNKLNHKILSFLYQFYKQRDMYNKQKRQVAFESLSNKQFMNFATDFSLQKHIKMEAVKKILNFNQAEPTKPGLSFESFCKAIEMIGAYIFSSNQDSHIEMQENLQQIYTILGFYNGQYRKNLGLPPGKSFPGYSNINYTKILDETQLQSQNITLLHSYQNNSKILQKSPQKNQNNINITLNLKNIKEENKSFSQEPKSNSNRSQKISSHGYSLISNSNLTTANRENNTNTNNNNQNYNNYNNNKRLTTKNDILPIQESNIENEMSYQSLKLSDVSDISEENNINNTLEQIINTTSDRKKLSIPNISQLQIHSNNNNSQLHRTSSQHNLTNDLIQEQKKIDQEDQEVETIENIKYFTKIMVQGQNPNEYDQEDQKSENELDENPFLYLDTMLNQRKKIKEIFYFYTKQKHGFHTFDGLQHELNVFSLGQFSQFCRQFSILRDQKKMIPNIFKRAGRMPKELTFDEFIDLLTEIGVKQFENDKQYKTKEEKVLAFYNYLGFDIQNSYKKKLVPIKKPFNIDVEDGFRLLDRDKNRYNFSQKKQESVDLAQMQREHQEEMRKLHQKQQEEGRKKLMKQIELQEREHQKNKHKIKEANKIIKSNYFEYSQAQGLQRARNSKSSNVMYVKRKIQSVDSAKNLNLNNNLNNNTNNNNLQNQTPSQQKQLQTNRQSQLTLPSLQKSQIQISQEQN